MKTMKPTVIALAALLPVTAMAEAIQVAKSPACGCCSAWVDHMAMAGHDMTT